MPAPPLEQCYGESVFGVSVHEWWKFVNTISLGISPNLQIRCSWAQRWTDYILWSKSQWSGSQQDHIRSHKHFRGHYLTYLRNARTYKVFTL